MDLYSILRLANVMDIETFLEALAGITASRWCNEASSKRQFQNPSDKASGRQEWGGPESTGFHAEWQGHVTSETGVVRSHRASPEITPRAKLFGSVFLSWRG